MEFNVCLARYWQSGEKQYCWLNVKTHFLKWCYEVYELMHYSLHMHTDQAVYRTWAHLAMSLSLLRLHWGIMTLFLKKKKDMFSMENLGNSGLDLLLCSFCNRYRQQKNSTSFPGSTWGHNSVGITRTLSPSHQKLVLYPTRTSWGYSLALP